MPANPARIFAVGRWYEQFEPVSDEVVMACLEQNRQEQSLHHRSDATSASNDRVGQHAPRKTDAPPATSIARPDKA